jgi:hypothetical protein
MTYNSKSSPAGFRVVGLITLAALCAGGANAASRADIGSVLAERAEARFWAAPGEFRVRELAAPTDRPVRVAKQYKYEIPKVDRAAPAPPQAAAPRAVPGPSLRSVPSGRARQGGRARSGPVSYGGSCELCRNSCYNSVHGTPQFVPCMRSCFNRLCRR